MILYIILWNYIYIHTYKTYIYTRTHVVSLRRGHIFVFPPFHFGQTAGEVGGGPESAAEDGVPHHSGRPLVRGLRPGRALRFSHDFGWVPKEQCSVRGLWNNPNIAVHKHVHPPKFVFVTHFLFVLIACCIWPRSFILSFFKVTWPRLMVHPPNLWRFNVGPCHPDRIPSLQGGSSRLAVQEQGWTSTNRLRTEAESSRQGSRFWG